MTSKAKTAGSSNVLKFPAIGGDDYDTSRVEDARPNLFDQLAAENLQREASRHYRREARKVKARAFIGYAVMVGVAVAIGITLAVGHS